MIWLRRMALPVALVAVALLALGLAGCKTTKAQQEYDSSPMEPEADPDRDSRPGPKPPT